MDKLFGISSLPVVPIRKEPSHRSEMVSQLLFGEIFSIIYSENDWVKISTLHDNYQGFVDLKQVFFLNSEEYEQLHYGKWGITKSPISIIIKNDSQNGTIIPAGSNLPNNGKISFGKTSFSYSPSIVSQNDNTQSEDSFREEIIKTALKFINAPYLWGGRTCFGIDCSGFSQLILKINGISILRDASQQQTQGQHVGFIDEAKSGDLLFFGQTEELITHVGIYMGEGYIIHASGSVRIDKVDHFGIFNTDHQSYTHSLRAIKNIISQ